MVKPEVKRPLGVPRLRWEGNREKDIQQAWTALIWLRLGAGGRHF
jgi:hypothetical protein